LRVRAYGEAERRRQGKGVNTKPFPQKERRFHKREWRGVAWAK
jgi:hypothetical protein